MTDEVSDEVEEVYSRTYVASANLALQCREIVDLRPPSANVLDAMINHLMTELWDQCFSQSEIRMAFEKAVADMPRYAAGEERRGDNSSSSAD